MSNDNDKSRDRDSKPDISGEVKKLALTDGLGTGDATSGIERVSTPPPPSVRKARKDKISAKEKRDCEGTFFKNILKILINIQGWAKNLKKNLPIPDH